MKQPTKKDFQDWAVDPYRLDASLNRMVDEGLIDRKHRDKITCRWVTNRKNYWAYVNIGCKDKIFFTETAYNLPNHFIDVVMWHELSHTLTNFVSHDDIKFKNMCRKRRWHFFNEWVLRNFVPRRR